ncbi:MAG: MFS transporter [Calditrichia bacterium]
MFKNIYKHYIASFTGLPRAAWLLSFVILVNRSGSMILAFMTLYLTTERGFSVPDAGKLVSLYGLGALTGAMLGGWLTDRFDAIKVQVFSLFFGGLSIFALGYAVNIWMIGLLIFLVSLISESYRPAHMSAMALVCPPEKRVRGFALSRLAINLGMSIGPAAGGFLARVDYHLLFWVDGITCILAGFLVIFFFRKSPLVAGESANPVVASTISPWRDTIFLIVMAFMILVGATFNQAFNTWPIYLKEFHTFIESDIGLMMALNAFLIVIFEMPIIHRLEHIRPMRLMAVGVVFFYLGFALLPLGSGIVFIAFTVVMWTIGEMLIFPVVAGFVAQRASERHRAKYMGLFSLGFGVSFVIGPTLGTWAYAVVGANEFWYCVGAVGFITLTGFMLVDRRI